MRRPALATGTAAARVGVADHSANQVAFQASARVFRERAVPVLYEPSRRACLAQNTEESRVTFSYVRGVIDGNPMQARLVRNRTAESVAVCDEIGFGMGGHRQRQSCVVADT
jgi:hypothetical protein